ncbi:acetate/propionate family kinase [Roseovarius sp. EGI FJ00037]|uniref:acetate/propionate family kinase n=1 Tax=Roseovarius salincola TaxID=2978479 RepID=UPI0022A83FAC|nr:acetate/propionate family kinase [Roseovarius sp. EGI FJ00037]MCZ0813079.1 acetate/propionate family kinase [Roseovarius sp. EGI FJ00037]
MEKDVIVTLNAGSSSLRCAVFECGQDGMEARLRLSLRGLPDAMIWERKDTRTGETEDARLDPPATPDKAQETALAEMTDRLLTAVDPTRIAAFSHRVVHGGQEFTAPVRVDTEVMKRLARLSPMAPSHQPHNLAAIRDLSLRFPDIPQIACFDTAFHKDLPHNDRVFALPKEMAEDGILRYGFHGLSYDHVASALRDMAPGIAQGRVVIAHLGHGASMCALHGGRSVATTMGMTALDGLPMGRRCGALDPGIVLYLIEERGMAPADVRETLYEGSGLAGLSGISGEMIELLESDASAASAAVAFFTYRCRREIGSLAAALGGLDALVFTGGIGENAPAIREGICADLGWLGVGIDRQANAQGASRISPEAGKVGTFVIPTDEEQVLARGAEEILQDRDGATG